MIRSEQEGMTWKAAVCEMLKGSAGSSWGRLVQVGQAPDMHNYSSASVPE